MAALAVVVSHTGIPKSAPEPLVKLAAWGHIGVPLFFMLSGFVLAYNYADLTAGDRRRTVLFYVARVARVMPLYWVMVAYCVAFYFAIGHVQYPGVLVQNIFAVQTWGSDVLAAQSRYNGPGWSIGVELFFYALFPFVAPLVARFANRFRLRGIALLVAAGAAISLSLWAWFVVTGRADLPAADGQSAHRWLYRNPLPHLVEFVVGLALAHALPYARRWSARTHHLVQGGVVAYVLGLGMFHVVGSGPWSAGSFGPFFVLPFAVGMLSLAADRGWLARALSVRVMVSLGTASYALYLTHRWFVWQLSTGDQIRTGEGLRPYVALVLTIAVLLVVAEGAHRYVETPARTMLLRLSRSVVAWRDERAGLKRSGGGGVGRPEPTDDPEVLAPTR
ncbi:hypothetical protein VV01_12360 [Luteipulveratus halotolerans]|uniref:Acyltransferase 3 domain-containing protein n=1 Tax=Luteipulveratus halotolerans TaxID=1631356 RepID=A0A0L6CJR6_9MICO|nr:hypothetical protein VV01_12360 [Luteipulveratus halotolerans]